MVPKDDLLMGKGICVIFYQCDSLNKIFLMINCILSTIQQRNREATRARSLAPQSIAFEIVDSSTSHHEKFKQSLVSSVTDGIPRHGSSLSFLNGGNAKPINVHPRNTDKLPLPNQSLRDGSTLHQRSTDFLLPDGAASGHKLLRSTATSSLPHRSQDSSKQPMDESQRLQSRLRLRDDYVVIAQPSKQVGPLYESQRNALNQAETLSKSKPNSMEHDPRAMSMHSSLEVDRKMANRLVERQEAGTSRETSKRPLPKNRSKSRSRELEIKKQSVDEQPRAFAGLDDWLEHCRDPAALSRRTLLREGRRDQLNPVVQDPSDVYNPYDDKEFMMEYEAELKMKSPQKINKGDEGCPKSTRVQGGLASESKLLDSMMRKMILTPNDRKGMRLSLPSCRSFPEQSLRIVKLLLGNDACCDCGQDDCERIWASVSHGTLLCIQCALRHITKDEVSNIESIISIRTIFTDLLLNASFS